MEQTKDTLEMLDLIDSPAFCVENGQVIRINDAARRLAISEGTNISSLLKTGIQEYSQFENGRLYLELKIGEVTAGASVSRIDGMDVFLLEDEADHTQLQAMALASQELRQPLSNVMTIANQLFPLTEDQVDPTLAQFIARINRGLFQMQRIIVNMSDAYRYETERITRKNTIDICGFINELFCSAAALIQHTGMRLEYTGLDESIFCLVDEEKLERAVNNILSNSLKFAPAGSTITAKLTRKGTMLFLSVHDSGYIREDLRSDVFNRFNRAPGVEDSRFGIGLGMVLIRNAATVHGGTVLLEQSGTNGHQLTMTVRIEQSSQDILHSPTLQVDYAGGWDHKLLELSDALPASVYQKEQIN